MEKTQAENSIINLVQDVHPEADKVPDVKIFENEISEVNTVNTDTRKVNLMEKTQAGNSIVTQDVLPDLREDELQNLNIKLEKDVAYYKYLYEKTKIELCKFEDDFNARIFHIEDKCEDDAIRNLKHRYERIGAQKVKKLEGKVKFHVEAYRHLEKKYEELSVAYYDLEERKNPTQMLKSDMEELDKLRSQAKRQRLEGERLEKENDEKLEQIAKYLQRAEETMNIQDTTIEKLWKLQGRKKGMTVDYIVQKMNKDEHEDHDDDDTKMR